MELNFYYAPITCATSAHIVLQESGLNYEPHHVCVVDGQHRRTDYIVKNPKGAVPALQIGEQLLTENQAILTYIADAVPDKQLIPPANTLLRARAHEWMNYCSSGLHPYVRSVFRPAAYAGESVTAQRAVRQQGIYSLQAAGRIVEAKLSEQNRWALGEHFSVCDAYLYIMYLWSRDPRMGSMTECSNWQRLALKVHQRLSTQLILKRELAFRKDYSFPDQFEM